jgi:hypothetical protein
MLDKIRFKKLRFVLLVLLAVIVYGCSSFESDQQNSETNLTSQNDYQRVIHRDKPRSNVSSGQRSDRVLNYKNFRSCDFLPTGFAPLERGRTFLETDYLDLMDSGYRKQQMSVLFFAATDQLLSRMRKIDRNGRSLSLSGSRFEGYCLNKLSEGTLLPYAIATVSKNRQVVSTREFELLQQEFAENLGVLMERFSKSGTAKAQQTLSDWTGRALTFRTTLGQSQLICKSKDHISIYTPYKGNINSSGGFATVTMYGTMTMLNIKGTVVYIYTYSSPSDTNGLKKFARWIDSLVVGLTL